MANEQNRDKYTHPDLRAKIKQELQESGKGGKPGQWSARKSQLLTQEYEKQGGGYKGDKDERQQNLEKWTQEEWTTQEGSDRARQSDETARYLPKEAWENLSEEEKRETERKKREGSRQGEQYVPNTRQAKQARRESWALPLRAYDDLNVEEVEKKLNGLSRKEVQTIHDYERQHENRKTLVQKLQSKIDALS